LEIIIQVDAMLPMWGNANQAFFSDVSAKYGRNGAWLASLGLGQRKIIQDNTLLGAYFFTDIKSRGLSHQS
jgi:hypothetical protein